MKQKAPLSAKQERLVLAMLGAESLEDAAKSAGVAYITAWRWSKLPEVDRALREAQRRVFGRALSKLQAYALEAASTLHSIMIDTKEPASVRLRAALGILEHGASANLIEQFSERIEQLEAALQEQGQVRRIA